MLSRNRFIPFVLLLLLVACGKDDSNKKNRLEGISKYEAADGAVILAGYVQLRGLKGSTPPREYSTCKNRGLRLPTSDEGRELLGKTLGDVDICHWQYWNEWSGMVMVSFTSAQSSYPNNKCTSLETVLCIAD